MAIEPPGQARRRVATSLVCGFVELESALFSVADLRLHKLRGPHSGLNLGRLAVGGKGRGDGSVK